MIDATPAPSPIAAIVERFVSAEQEQCELTFSMGATYVGIIPSRLMTRGEFRVEHNEVMRALAVQGKCVAWKGKPLPVLP